MDTVIDYINVQRILGLPGKAIKKQQLQCWTLPEDAQVDTGDEGIITVAGGSVVVEIGPKKFRYYSMEEFTELFVLADDFKNEYDEQPEEPDPEVEHEFEEGNETVREEEAIAEEESSEDIPSFKND